MPTNHATKDAVKSAIDAVVTSNANNEITGALLRELLKDIITFCLPNNLVKGEAGSEYAYLRMAGFDGTNNQAGDLRRGMDDDNNDTIWIYEGGDWEVLGGND